jgi:hypothetical protein
MRLKLIAATAAIAAGAALAAGFASAETLGVSKPGPSPQASSMLQEVASCYVTRRICARNWGWGWRFRRCMRVHGC